MDVANGIDHEVAALRAAGCTAQAATAGLRYYGPELLGFLQSLEPSQATADELFSELCERIWRGLPEFRGDCSFRSWAYRIARNLVVDRRRRDRMPWRRCLDADEVSAIERLAVHVRTTTPVYMRKDTKDRLDRIRRTLSVEEQALLILRVDRQLSWREVAEVLHDESEDPQAADRAVPRLRKRFERLKERIRAELVTA